MPRYNWYTSKVDIIHQSKSKWPIILLYNRLKFKLPGNNYVNNGLRFLLWVIEGNNVSAFDITRFNCIAKQELCHSYVNCIFILEKC